MTIEEYMRKTLKKEDADRLIDYFQRGKTASWISRKEKLQLKDVRIVYKVWREENGRRNNRT
ncbi:MAG: hypothetical protein FIB08_03670 [Candidatus Methanoperedens sp.]|nr:hypothetical protein [Candidatus Methanoperedens sp.]